MKAMVAHALPLCIAIFSILLITNRDESGIHEDIRLLEMQWGQATLEQVSSVYYISLHERLICFVGNLVASPIISPPKHQAERFRTAGTSSWRSSPHLGCTALVAYSPAQAEGQCTCAAQVGAWLYRHRLPFYFLTLNPIPLGEQYVSLF